MGLKPSDITFEPEIEHEDRTKYEEGIVTWVNLVWHDFKLEKGHSMDDDEWLLLYKGKHVAWIRDLDKAKEEILLLVG